MSNWRDIPMPDQVAALRRSEGALPVPYVAQWSSEESVGSARPDDLLKQLGCAVPAMFSSGAPGQGRPVFGVMEPSRQREVAILCRCQVCNTALLPRHACQPSSRHRVWLAQLHNASQASDVAFDGAGIRINGRVRPLIIEPWVCESCLTYALRVCPGLLGMSYQPVPDNPARELRLLHVRRASCVATYAKHAQLGVVVSYVKLAAIDYDVVHAGQFLERQAVTA